MSVNFVVISVGGRAPPEEKSRPAVIVGSFRLPDVFCELLYALRLRVGRPGLMRWSMSGLLDPEAERLGAITELRGYAPDEAPCPAVPSSRWCK